MNKTENPNSQISAANSYSPLFVKPVLDTTEKATIVDLKELLGN